MATEFFPFEPARPALEPVRPASPEAACPESRRACPAGPLEGEPQGAEPALERLPTYISPGIRVKGTITSAEDLYIDGDVQGYLSVPSHRLIVGERAYITAETVAGQVVIYGAVQGGLLAHDRIEIKKHASVAGDLATAQIVIEDGANFKGAIDVTTAKAPKPRLRP